MAKRDEAALKLLRWELAGHGGLVLEAMLRHPDKNLADAVELIEREIPSLSPREPQKDPPPELPMPAAPRGRSSSELDALGQEYQTFRHLLRPREAKEVEGELKELARTRDRDAMVALRRRLRALSSRPRSGPSWRRGPRSRTRSPSSSCGRARRSWRRPARPRTSTTRRSRR